MSRDEATGKTEAKTVKRLFKRQVKATLVLSFSNGDKIECTKEHPFYVEHKGFTPAGELGIGTSIVTRAGPAVQLTHVETKRETATVYNFEVEDFHSYFVGNHDSGLWVHNGCGHHSIPKFLGGDPQQPLIDLEAPIHRQYHQLLHRLLKSKGLLGGYGGRGNSTADWGNFMQVNPGAQGQALDSAFDAARITDAQHGTEIVQHMWANIMNGRFTSHP